MSKDIEQITPSDEMSKLHADLTSAIATSRIDLVICIAIASNVIGRFYAAAEAAGYHREQIDRLSTENFTVGHREGAALAASHLKRRAN